MKKNEKVKNHREEKKEDSPQPEKEEGSEKQGTTPVGPTLNEAENETIQFVAAEELHISPEYLALVPRPTREEYLALKTSIQKDGQREEVIVNDELLVIDGHTRTEILRELGIRIRIRIKTFKNKDEEMDYVVKSAVLRRNLSVFQKIKMAQPRLKMERGQAGERKRLGKALPSSLLNAGSAIEVVSKEFGIASTTFERGQYLLKNASPEQLKELEEDSLTINGLYALVKSQKMKKKGENDGAHGTNDKDNRRANSSTTNNSNKNSESESDHKKTGETMRQQEEDEANIKPIDKETDCHACKKPFPRGDLKESLLCMECRAKAGMDW